MEGKNSFVFYETFLDCVDCLPEEEQLPFIRSIIEYGIYGKEPFYSGATKGMWLAIKNGIDNCKERRKKAKTDGAKGGRPLKTAEKPTENLKVFNNKLGFSDSNLKVETENLKVNTEKPHENNENLNVNENVNVNEKVNVNVNVSEKAKLSTSTSTDGNKTKITSDDVREHLQVLGYDVNPVSCGTIASLLNFHCFPLEYIDYVENKVSDRYTDISASLMVNALTTWIELVDDYKKERKTAQKKKAEEKALPECVVCGEKLGSMNWINGKYNAYFCTTCHTNYLKQSNGEWIQQDEL